MEFLANVRYGDVYRVVLGPESFVEALLRTGFFQPPWRVNIVPIVETKSEYYRQTMTLVGLSFALDCEPSIFLNLLYAVLRDFLENYRSYIPDGYMPGLVFNYFGRYYDYDRNIRLKQVEITIYPRDNNFYMQWTIPREELPAPVHDPIRVEMLDKDEKKWREFKRALLKVLGVER